MDTQGVMVSYAISRERIAKNTPPISGSGIKIDNNWILCHGTLFSPLKIPLKILQSADKRKIANMYSSLPDVHVTLNVSKFTNILLDIKNNANQ